MDKIKYFIMAVLIGTACFSIGKFFSPEKVKIKEVEKVVYREHNDVKQNSDRTTVKKETVLPDGTKVTETSTTDKKSSETKTDVTLNKETVKESKTTARPEWLVGVGYTPFIPSVQDKVFTLNVQKNLISELYLGVSISAQKPIELSISIGF